MSNSTIKHASFINEPLGEKPVTKLPGVGTALGSRLNDKGYHKVCPPPKLTNARQIYEKAEELKFDKSDFIEWFSSACGANSKYSSDCYEALYEWHRLFGSKTPDTDKKGRSRKSDCAVASKPRTLIRSSHSESSENDDDCVRKYFCRIVRTNDAAPAKPINPELTDDDDFLEETFRRNVKTNENDY